MTSQIEKKRLRLLHISQRNKLNPHQQLTARFNLSRQARAYNQLLNCNNVLAYSPIAGEIDPALLILNLKAEIHLPRIMHFRNGLMHFFKINELTENKLGIKEPLPKNPRISAKHLDAVLVPLVAFDRRGNRLGMGAGFYDRSFSFRKNSSYVKRPLLIGLAHHCQETNSLVSDSWDVTLDAIITDRELIRI